MKKTSKKINKKVETKKDTAVSYQGQVTVSLMKNNKLYNTKTFKNSGRWPLFYFLAQCLKGTYYQADAVRPRFLRMFYYGDPNTPSQIPTLQTLETPENLAAYFNEGNCVSIVRNVPYMDNPKDEYIDGGIGSASVTYKFTVPFTQIATQKGVNILGLYSNTYNDHEDVAAFIMVEDSEHPGYFGNILTPEELQMSLDDYNLYIEWKLMINNSTK